MVTCCGYVMVFVFVKQKTAYEMRISDWSSDVCSSDLDYKSALASYEKVIVSPELPAEEKVWVLDSYVKLAYTAKDYARAATAIQQYQAAGGTKDRTSVV